MKTDKNDKMKMKKEILMPALKEAFGIVAISDGYNAVYRAMQEHTDQAIAEFKRKLKEDLNELYDGFAPPFILKLIDDIQS